MEQQQACLILHVLSFEMEGVPNGSGRDGTAERKRVTDGVEEDSVANIPS